MIKLIFCIGLILLMTGCENFPDLGNGYKLSYNSMNDVSIIKCLKEGDAPTILIYGHILDYAFDSTFIIVIECPRDSVPGVTTMTYSEYEKAFEQSAFRQYWIINKKEEPTYIGFTGSKNNPHAIYSNVYGPYRKEEYLKKRKELNISNELQFD